jgi:hypothetical protein
MDGEGLVLSAIPPGMPAATAELLMYSGGGGVVGFLGLLPLFLRPSSRLTSS